MNALVYTDLHLREDALPECIYALRKVGELAAELGVDQIFNLGDTFNTRGVIKTRCWQALYEVYRDWSRSGIRQTIIVGNHDQEDKAGEIHPMKVFEEFDGWNVIGTPDVIDGVLFMPYMPIDKIKSFLTNTVFQKNTTAFVHWGICGAMMNNWKEDTDGVPSAWLKNFKHVYSGHYHFRNRFENIQYIGNLLQKDFAEMGQEKGVTHITDRGSKFIPIKGTPRHFEVKVSWDKRGEMVVDAPGGITKKDFVRAMVSGDSERVTGFSRESLELECRSLKVERDIKAKSVSRMNLSSSEIHDQKSLIKKYVEFIDTDLDKEKLLKIGMEMLNVAV